MTVFYETEFDKSGDVLDVGHIRVLKASGTSCCSGDNPDHFCESCKAEINTDFAKLKANKVRPVIHYFIPSTGELIRRPERKRKPAPKVTPQPTPPPRAAAQPPSNAAPPPPSILDLVRRKAKALLTTTNKVNDSGVPDAPNLVAAVRKRKKQTKTKSERLLERARASNASGVPEPKSMEEIIRSKK